MSSHIKHCCSLSPTSSCNGNSHCEKVKLKKGLTVGDLIYNGPNLPTTGIKNSDTLDVALSKIDKVIMSLVNQ